MAEETWKEYMDRNVASLFTPGHDLRGWPGVGWKNIIHHIVQNNIYCAGMPEDASPEERAEATRTQRFDPKVSSAEYIRAAQIVENETTKPLFDAAAALGPKYNSIEVYICLINGFIEQKMNEFDTTYNGQEYTPDPEFSVESLEFHPECAEKRNRQHMCRLYVYASHGPPATGCKFRAWQGCTDCPLLRTLESPCSIFYDKE